MAGRALSLEGAEKVLAEFLQSEGAIAYYIFVDSGERRNLIKLACLLILSVSLTGLFFLKGIVFSAVFIIISLASVSILILTYRKLFLAAKENFPKEKLFLTEKNVIVQHSLQRLKVKYVPIDRYKRLERMKTPFGEFATLVYLDGEGLSELREKLYFPEKPEQLAESLNAQFERVQKAAAEKKKE
ncbi:MAG: hypothetical protein V1820_05720 [archaeon]